MKILICDDLSERCESSANAIQLASGIEPVTLSEQRLKESLATLFSDIQDYFSNPLENTDISSPFDDYDLIVIDNNLSHLQIAGARMTAEAIAGYIRAFSNVGYIVSLNKMPEVDFDLRYLMGDYTTRADLAINFEHLENPHLWSRTSNVGSPGDSFYPWYWPELLEVPDQRRTQIAGLADALGEQILGYLGFDSKRVRTLLPHAREVISPTASFDEFGQTATELESITVLQFFQARDRSIQAPVDRELLALSAAEGESTACAVVARVVAADIDHWLRRDVVGPQYTIVDIPHLLMRYPFLLGDEAGTIDGWNKVISSDMPPYGLDASLYAEHVGPRMFSDGTWGSRPCVWWVELKDNKVLNQLFFSEGEPTWEDAVFCEDTSQFVVRDEDLGVPTEFVAQFDGPYARRHIRQLDGYQYSPKTRLAVPL